MAYSGCGDGGNATRRGDHHVHGEVTETDARKQKRRRVAPLRR
jgi:hypothetical protein